MPREVESLFEGFGDKHGFGLLFVVVDLIDSRNLWHYVKLVAPLRPFSVLVKAAALSVTTCISDDVAVAAFLLPKIFWAKMQARSSLDDIFF